MSEEDDLLTYAKEQVRNFSTQADLVAEMVAFAQYAGHTQLMAERMARYVWDTQPERPKDGR